MEKVIITSAIEKEYGGKKFLAITLKDGRVGSSNDLELKENVEQEIELEVKQGKVYNEVQQYYFNLPKQKTSGNFQKKDWTFEKRRVALECAVEVCKRQNVTSTSSVTSTADQLFNWLNQDKL